MPKLSKDYKIRHSCISNDSGVSWTVSNSSPLGKTILRSVASLRSSSVLSVCASLMANASVSEKINPEVRGYGEGRFSSTRYGCEPTSHWQIVARNTGMGQLTEVVSPCEKFQNWNVVDIRGAGPEAVPNMEAPILSPGLTGIFNSKLSPKSHTTQWHSDFRVRRCHSIQYS